MYVLKANSKTQGTVYYMNVIMITEQPEYAEQYNTIEEAENDIQHFKNMFHYEDIEPVIEEYNAKENANG